MSMLFTPFTIGSLTVKNRFVRSATQDWLGHEDGRISEAQVELYENLARGDVGMIITAHAYVQHPLGRASIRQNGIYDDRFIDGYRLLAQAAHRHGAKLIVQISHAGRQTSPDLTEGETPVAPSAVIDRSTGITPREMTGDEIWALINAFVTAAERVKKAGCDGVQLHIAHGYCLSQFLSPYTNRRQDEWGGSIENRTRIIREIMVRCREAVGSDFPILAKLNCTDGLSGPGYLTREDVVYTARLLERLGAAAIEVSGGIREAKGVMSRPNIRSEEDEAYFAADALAIKEAIRIPVILVGGLRSMATMEGLLQNGYADMIALSRPFIKEPNLVERLRAGQVKAKCISCNACFNPAGLACRYEK